VFSNTQAVMLEEGFFMTNIQVVPPPHISMPAKTILVVDDSASIRHMLDKMMNVETPYQPIFATTCAEALEIIGIIKPQLFLFDYQLPDMSGLELYDKLHTRKALRYIPTIIMSSELPRQEIEKRNILGIEKPFHLNVLLCMIEGVVQSTQIEPTSNRSASTSGILSLAL